MWSDVRARHGCEQPPPAPLCSLSQATGHGQPCALRRAERSPPWGAFASDAWSAAPALWSPHRAPPHVRGTRWPAPPVAPARDATVPYGRGARRKLACVGPLWWRCQSLTSCPAHLPTCVCVGRPLFAEAEFTFDANELPAPGSELVKRTIQPRQWASEYKAIATGKRALRAQVPSAPCRKKSRPHPNLCTTLPPHRPGTQGLSYTQS